MSTPSRTSSADPSSEREDSKLQSTIDKVQAFGNLEPNWDSYGALTIDPTCRQMAVQFLRWLDPGVPIPSAVPTAHGGVQLEWHCRGVDLEIEFDTSFQISVFFEDLRTRETREIDLSDDWQPLKAILDRLSQDS